MQFRDLIGLLYYSTIGRKWHASMRMQMTHWPLKKLITFAKHGPSIHVKLDKSTMKDCGPL